MVGTWALVLVSLAPALDGDRADTEVPVLPIPIVKKQARVPKIPLPRVFTREFWQSRGETPPANPLDRSQLDAVRQAQSTRPSNATLESRVAARLREDRGLRTEPIFVEAHDGVITLQGVVANARYQARAESLAAKVEGVVRVRNELEIPALADTTPVVSTRLLAPVASATQAGPTEKQAMPESDFASPSLLDPIPAVALTKTDQPLVTPLSTSFTRGDAVGVHRIVSPKVTLPRRPGLPIVRTYTIRESSLADSPVPPDTLGPDRQ